MTFFKWSFLSFMYMALPLSKALTGCTEIKADDECSFLAFSPSAMTTKAVISSTDYPTSIPFYIGAWTNGTSLYFSDEVSYSDSHWTTDPAQTWPSDGSLTFQAYSPSSLSSSGIASDVALTVSGVTTGTYTIQTETAMQTDFCYASNTVDCTSHGSSVPLNFYHALSQITVKAKADAESADTYFTIDYIALRNVYSSAQSFSVPADYTSSGFASLGDKYDYVLFDETSVDLENRTKKTSLNTSPTALEIVPSTLLLPQTLPDDAAVRLTFTRVKTGETPIQKTVDIDLSDLTANWGPGQQYPYTIVLSTSGKYIMVYSWPIGDWTAGDEGFPSAFHIYPYPDAGWSDGGTIPNTPIVIPSSTNVVLGASGGDSASFTIQASTDWTAAVTTGDWFTISPASGTAGITTITVTASSSYEAGHTGGIITFTYDTDKTATVNVTQNAS